MRHWNKSSNKPKTEIHTSDGYKKWSEQLKGNESTLIYRYTKSANSEIIMKSSSWKSVKLEKLILLWIDLYDCTTHSLFYWSSESKSFTKWPIYGGQNILFRFILWLEYKQKETWSQLDFGKKNEGCGIILTDKKPVRCALVFSFSHQVTRK